MDYKETLDVLYNMMPDFQHVGAGAYKPGLERAVEFNNLLGRPDRSFDAVHVAGTNGKGSVAHMLASVLQSAGYRVGLYTSPHLRDFRERIRVDGETIPEDAVVDFAHKHIHTMQAIGLSFFEATMCMAFDWFARCDVEVAVVEAGLGGRLDSTNILRPLASVITNIGLDHQQFLGDTLASIAAEKAGIIKCATPVVVGEHGAESDDVFLMKANAEGSQLFFAEDMYGCLSAVKDGRKQFFSLQNIDSGARFELESDLLGDYQSRNIVTLLGTLSVLNHHTALTISQRALSEGVAAAALATGLRGRWEVLGHHPLVVADTGHNTHGLRLVAEQLRGEHYAKLYMVIGFVADKDLDSVLPLLPAGAHYIFTAPSVARAMPAVELASRAAAHGLNGEVVSNAADAIARARELASADDMIFVGGSTFTVADVI